jgi:Putative lumazine-binding
MRALAILLFAAAPLFAAESPDEKAAITAVQKLFDAMAAHDSEAARAVVIPEGRLYSTRPDGKPSGMALEEFAAMLSTRKEPMLERIWNPTVLLRGPIAQVWAEYDFYLSGKFHHCGIDSVSLIKSDDAWKIAGIVYTSETSACPVSPLGPPK